MAIATRYRPGVHGAHSGALVAAAVVALMGFYGFARGVQHSELLRDVTLVSAPAQDEARPAVATGAIPSLAYAVMDRWAVEAPAEPAARPAPAAPAAPAEIALTTQPLAVPPVPATETAPPVEPAAAQTADTSATAPAAPEVPASLF